MRDQAGTPTLLESVEELTTAVARVRDLRPQLLMLPDFRYAKSVLEPQSSALPFAVVPDWPIPQPGAGIVQYAEVCCQEWLWGPDRPVDPRRPYSLCGFGQSCRVAFEIGQQMSLAGQRPAAVIQIGPNDGGTNAPRTLLRRGGGLLADLLVTIRERWGEDEPRESRRKDDVLIRKAAQEADPRMTAWAKEMLGGRRKRGVELAPFPVFELDGAEPGPGFLMEERRRQIRPECGTINVRRATEVNAFLLRTLLSLSSSPGGQNRTRERQVATRSASETLEEVARQIAEAETELNAAKQHQLISRSCG